MWLLSMQACRQSWIRAEQVDRRACCHHTSRAKPPPKPAPPVMVRMATARYPAHPAWLANNPLYFAAAVRAYLSGLRDIPTMEHNIARFEQDRCGEHGVVFCDSDPCDA